MDERKLPRSKRVKYDIGGVFFVTVCCREMLPLLERPEAKDFVAETIEAVSNEDIATIHCYVVMNNHLHFLALLPKTQPLPSVVRLIKGRAAASLRNVGIRNVWQKSYHDHLVRRPEETYGIGQYILENPVRKGYVLHWQDYKWCKIVKSIL